MNGGIPNARWLCLIVLGLVCTLSAQKAAANMMRPLDPPTHPPQVTPEFVRPGQPVQVPFVVVSDPNQVVSRIVIPKKFLREGAVLVPSEVSRIEPTPNSSAAVGSQPNDQADGSSPGLRNRTVVAGTALSSIIAGGVFVLVFVRRRKKSPAATAGLVLLACMVLLVGTTMADISAPRMPFRTNLRPPPEPPWPLPSLRNRTVVAGTALSSIIAGGVFVLVFVRRRKKDPAATAGLVLLAGMVLLVGTTMAEVVISEDTNRSIKPPPTLPSPAVHGSLAQFWPKNIIVETSETGDQVILVIGKKHAGPTETNSGELTLDADRGKR